MHILFQISKFIAWLCRQVGALCLLLMVTVTMLDVITRFLFKLTDGNFSFYVKGAVELSSYLMLCALLCAIVAFIDRAQVVVDVFTHRLPESIKRILQGVFLLGFAGLGIELTVGFYKNTAGAWLYGETTQDLNIALWPIYVVGSLLTIMLTLRSCIESVALIQGKAYTHHEELVDVQ